MTAYQGVFTFGETRLYRASRHGIDSLKIWATHAVIKLNEKIYGANRNYSKNNPREDCRLVNSDMHKKTKVSHSIKVKTKTTLSITHDFPYHNYNRGYEPA
jgi:hypothetical protein